MGDWSQENNWTISKIIYESKKFNFDPPYQRSDNAWDNRQKDNLINSLICGYPIPPVYLIDKENENLRYTVVDGKQRLSTIVNYFKKDSSKTIQNINIESLKALKSLYVNKDFSSFSFDGILYTITNGQVTILENDVDSFEEPNLSQLRELQRILANKCISSNCIKIYDLRSNLELVSSLFQKKLNVYIGNGCDVDEELTVFRCLNAGSALSIYEHYNGMYSNYEIWLQAKKIAQSIKHEQRPILYAGFLYGDRCEDYKFWADILLTICNNESITNITLKDWKYDASNIAHIDQKADTEIIKMIKRISTFLITNVCSRINKTKRTPKIQTALFLYFYYREKEYEDCYDFYAVNGLQLDSIIQYINTTSLSNKKTKTIINDLIEL